MENEQASWTVGEQPIDTTLLTFPWPRSLHFLFQTFMECVHTPLTFCLPSSLMYTQLEVSHSYTPYIYLLTLGRTYASHFRYLQSHVHLTGGLTSSTFSHSLSHRQTYGQFVEKSQNILASWLISVASHAVFSGFNLYLCLPTTIICSPSLPWASNIYLLSIQVSMSCRFGVWLTGGFNYQGADVADYVISLK